MGITTPTLVGAGLSPIERINPWVVNNSAIAGFGVAEELKAAPTGNGKALYLTHVTMSGHKVADFKITGTLNPDATGDYFEYGTFAGQPTYRRADEAFYIYWFSGPLQWAIAVIPHEAPSHYWLGEDTTILGDYTSAGNNTGTATVAAIVDVNITLQDEDGTVLYGPIQMQSNGSGTFTKDWKDPLKLIDNKALYVFGNVGGASATVYVEGFTGDVPLG